MKKDKMNDKVQVVIPKNYNIGTRIAISALCAILIPVLILTPMISLLSYTISSYFDFSNIADDSYSTTSIIQWNQTVNSISEELISESNNKYDNVKAMTKPLEGLGSLVYIEKNGQEFYSSNEKKTILKKAYQILPFEISQNIHYFSENGILIVKHIKSESNNDYMLLIANPSYIINDTTPNYDDTFADFIFSRTGIIVMCIAIIFIISIIIFSIITSKTISVPIQKVAMGANEIAKGNLDYKIDYQSTNEIGVLVDSFNDMTEQLKEANEKKEKADQVRKETLAGIAHDLRTPLTSIKGYVEGLMDGIANTPEKQKRYLETIYSSAINTEKMLDDLLTISKLELGNIELSLKKISVLKFFDDCASDIKLDLDKENFDFEYNNKCDTDTFISVDTDRFTRVIRNIISNSIKYKKPNIKGEIKLEVESYEKSVIISIEDNGIGIESENLDRIFESLYRTDPARSMVSQGSGIGLAVCKQIVELHNGRIWAKSEINEGLTIFIALDRIVGDKDEKNINS